MIERISLVQTIPAGQIFRNPNSDKRNEAIGLNCMDEIIESLGLAVVTRTLTGV